MLAGVDALIGDFVAGIFALLKDIFDDRVARIRAFFPALLLCFGLGESGFLNLLKDKLLVSGAATTDHFSWGAYSFK